MHHSDSLPGTAQPQPRADEREGLVLGEVFACRGSTVAVLECPGAEPALTDDDAVWNAKQLRIGEFNAGTRIAIVVQHFDAGGAELGIVPRETALSDRAR